MFRRGHAQAFALLTVSLLLIPLAATPPSHLSSVSSHSITISQDEITIQTQTVSMVLSIPEKGTILNITNLMTNQYLKMNQSVFSTLWAVNTFSQFYGSNSATAFSYTTSQDSNSSTLEMAWQYGTLFDANAIIQAESDGSITMRMNVTNLSPTMEIQRVFFPYLGGIESLGPSPIGNNIALPMREGYVIENATSSITAHPDFFEYPGTLSMQWAYFYQNNLGGIYFGVYDNNSNYKGIELFRDNSDAFRFDWYHYAVDITPGNSFAMTYPVVIRGVVGADWTAGADIYKQWALKQWYVSRGPISQRTDVPAWLKNLDFVWSGRLYTTNDSNGQIILSGVNSSELPAYASGVKAVLPNASIMLYLTGWNKDGFDRGYPDYYPPRDGAQAFQQALAAVHQMGLRTLPYFNGRLVDTASPTYNTSKPYLTVDQNGNFYTETYNGGYLKAVVPAPSTAWWKSTVINYTAPMVCTYGADGVYLDQISVAPPNLDMSTTHGHLPGGGSWWWQAESSVLEGVRSAMRVCNPQAVVSSENVNEVYIRDIDIFSSYDFLYDFRPDFPFGMSAPIFSYVYHGYALQYITFIPPSGTPTNAESMFLHALAESLVRGYVPGVDTSQSPEDTWYFNQLSASYIQTVVQARQEFKDFLSNGTTPGLPTFLTQQAEFSGVPVYPNTISSPSIATGVFQLPDGREIVIQVNRVTSQPSESGSFDHGLPYSGQTAWMTVTTDNQTSKIALVNTKSPIDVIIPQLSIETLILEPPPVLIEVAWQGTTHGLPVSTSSQIESVTLDSVSKSIIFVVDELGAAGFLHVVLPRSMVPGEYSVMVDGRVVDANEFQNSTIVSVDVNFGNGLQAISVSGLASSETTVTTTLTSTVVSTLGVTSISTATVTSGIPSTLTAPTTVSQTVSPTSGGIPEFPYQPLAVMAATAVIIVSFVFLRHRTVRAPT